MGYAQLVIGPAGSGKVRAPDSPPVYFLRFSSLMRGCRVVYAVQSTYCSSLYDHCQTVGRTIHIVNLDPAAEHFNYPVDMVNKFLRLIFPGQIELFTHVPVLRNFVEHLKRKNFSVCAVYLLDSQFVSDVTKYISGCMASLSAMIQLELPHINILSKMDLISNKKDVEEYLDPNAQVLLSQLNRQMAPRFGKLNKCLAELVDDYSMVNFIPLDLRKESSIQYVLSYVDSCIQYGEDADVKVRDFDLPEDDD
ncbi:GPN-loop GTPase 3 [Dichanthelium oligosanthes]|uniref:GPN-loop GTPase 3 n=1 Tax=Dichanthelium oligosanthes TaxID=888268 RepID=A0A1E5UK91_9POAL|nr:GPN-loop GTPase 3 [Dichanthelium oligosanthes]